MARTGTLNGFPCSSTLVEDQLKQLQHENKQLLSLSTEQTDDLQQTRAWLKSTQILLAGKERSRLLAIYQCHKVREATRHIERCAKGERAERLVAEERLRESRLQEERIGVEILNEMSFQNHLRARLEILKASLKEVEFDVETEEENQKELGERLRSRRQEEKEINSYSHDLDIEEIKLTAEAITNSSLQFQNNARKELEKSCAQEIDELKQKITERKDQIRKLEVENVGLTASSQGQKAKMVSR